MLKDSADKGRIERAKMEYERIRNMKYGEYNDFRKEINQKRRARDLNREFKESSSDSYDDEDDSS